MISNLYDNISKIMFDKGQTEFENRNYASILTYYLNTNWNDSGNIHNILVCYDNIANSFFV